MAKGKQWDNFCWSELAPRLKFSQFYPKLSFRLQPSFSIRLTRLYLFPETIFKFCPAFIKTYLFIGCDQPGHFLLFSQGQTETAVARYVKNLEAIFRTNGQTSRKNPRKTLGEAQDVGKLQVNWRTKSLISKLRHNKKFYFLWF